MNAPDQPESPSEVPVARSGRLEVICGPMFAGKTTELMLRLLAARDSGRQVLAVKPGLDTRYHATHLATHDGKLLEAAIIESPVDLSRHSADVIGLDEAHFFREGLHEAILPHLERGTRVILAGLDRTSMNQPFGEMARLLIEADEVIKLTAPCAICGEAAIHTIRLFDSTEDIVVGGPGMFENRCRRHLHDPPPRRQSAS